jgi:hypothetical protein
MTRCAMALLITLALGLLVAPLAAEAQPPTPVYRIGYLLGATREQEPFVEAFLEGMRVLGYVEGQNLDLRHGSCDTTSFRPLGTLSCWSGGVRISFRRRALGHWLHARANRASRSVYRDALAPRTP